MHIYSITLKLIQLVAGGYVEDGQGFYECESDALEEAYRLADIHFGSDWNITNRYVDPRGWEALYSIYPANMTHGVIQIEQVNVTTAHEAEKIQLARLGFELNEDYKRKEHAQMQAIDEFFDELSC